MAAERKVVWAVMNQGDVKTVWSTMELATIELNRLETIQANKPIAYQQTYYIRPVSLD